MYSNQPQCPQANPMEMYMCIFAKKYTNAKLSENGTQQQCWQVYGWHIWIPRFDFRRRSPESCRWMSGRCVPAPQRSCMDRALPNKIDLFEWKALEAARGWCWKWKPCHLCGGVSCWTLIMTQGTKTTHANPRLLQHKITWICTRLIFFDFEWCFLAVPLRTRW